VNGVQTCALPIYRDAGPLGANPAARPYTRGRPEEGEDRMSFGPEWFIVLGVIVLLFGAKKLPELARSLGRSTNEFKKGMKEGGADRKSVGASPKADAAPEARTEDPSL